MVRLTFINSFPDSISIELQQSEGVDTMAISDIMKRARMLTATLGSGNVGFGIWISAMK